MDQAREHPSVHAKTASSAGKFQVTVFWDCEGVIHIDYCPPGQTINAEYYSNLLKIVHKLIPEKRRGKVPRRPLLLQDNARVHTAKPTMTTMNNPKWQLLPHPLYSPDLAPSEASISLAQ
jgi:histone-lysine N-methyltransferase SETMAR